MRDGVDQSHATSYRHPVPQGTTPFGSGQAPLVGSSDVGMPREGVKTSSPMVVHGVRLAIALASVHRRVTTPGERQTTWSTHTRHRAGNRVERGLADSEHFSGEGGQCAVGERIEARGYPTPNTPHPVPTVAC